MGCRDTAPAVMPLPMPITSTDRGSWCSSIGMCPDMSWVGMSTAVPASIFPFTRRKTWSPSRVTATVPLIPSR